MKRTTDHNVMQKALVIPIFIMNRGCPEKCTYCNEKIAAGDYPQIISKDLFNAEVESYLRWNKDKLRSAQIAFYGGSFTGLDTAYQNHLLAWAGDYIRRGLVESIRISTRPDLIDEDTLVFLKKHGVKTVEIGAQSFDDSVLKSVNRSHDAATIMKAVLLLKSHGFQTGLHLMAGLPGDNREGFIRSLARTVELKPDMARIHPVIVFNHTPLADEYRQGRYQPLGLTEAVDLCVLAWEMLTPAGISIIRLGLQTTPEMSRAGAVLAGPMHPAFGSLVYCALYYQYTIKLLEGVEQNVRQLRFDISEQESSHFRGQRSENIARLKERYPNAQILIETAPATARGRISVQTDTGESLSVSIPGMN